jgi:hypothetical protein
MTLSNKNEQALDPQIALDPYGGAVAVWERSGDHGVIEAAFGSSPHSTPDRHSGG